MNMIINKVNIWCYMHLDQQSDENFIINVYNKLKESNDIIDIRLI